MPELSRFFGIVITMFFGDHPPPHFHARYGEFEAQISIDPVALLEGRLPPRVFGLVIEWATLHRAELLSDWEHAARQEPVQPIAPLE